MKTRTLLLIAMALVGFCLHSPCYAQSTTVRGRLLDSGQSPAAGIQVTIFSQSFGRSSRSMTGNDGMYYIYNVPFGDYYLEVWISTPPKAYPVHITGYPYHDLPRLSVPVSKFQKLKDAHFAFIDHHTCVEGTRAKWDQASFDSEVAKITQQFTDAEAAESKAVPARKEFIRNSANLFRRDAALVQKQHCLSPSFAANKMQQLQENYDLFLQQTSS
jgi:hypothetical protein